jgi:FixJ family two-component response regulator
VKEASFTVYVVDDDASIRKALERLLGSVGYQTLTFDSAEALLELPLGNGVKAVWSWIFAFRG